MKTVEDKNIKAFLSNNKMSAVTFSNPKNLV